MDFSKVSAISASGMLAQKTRIETAATNLANVNTTQAAGQSGYQPLATVIRSSRTGLGPAGFAQALGSPERLSTVRAEVVQATGVEPTLAFEPGHPDADVNGMVRYPGVNHTHEMLAVTTALRLYEANLSVLQASKTLAAKALEIGGQS
jgi:flagellar basal-body rod protein FlgC